MVPNITATIAQELNTLVFADKPVNMTNLGNVY